MAKFNFNLRSSKSSKTTPINLVIRWNNNRLVFPTQETILPKYWNAESQRIKSTRQFPEHPEFNARLDAIESTAKDAFRRFQNDNENAIPTKEQLRKLLKENLGQEEKEVFTLYSFAEKLIEEQTQRIKSKGKFEGRNTIVNSYKQTISILKEYQTSKRKPINFETIDLDFYYDFVEFLESRNYALNTIGKYIKTLKTFLNEANEREVTDVNAHKSKHFKVLKEEIDTIYLDNEELDELYKLDLSKRPALERARDLFLVGCYTGLRFSDFTRIEPKHIKGGFISITQQKTGAPVVIPIHPIVTSIMSKYEDVTFNGFPPAISNQKLNEYIKEIGKKLDVLNKHTSTTITRGGKEITKNLSKYELITTHTARRSFATNQYNVGVPSITIMAITGHKTEKAFLRYIKVTPDQHAKILQSYWSRENLKVV